VAKPPHPADPLPAYISREQRPEPVPPKPYRFVADVDAALGQQVFDISANSAETGRPSSQPGG